MILVLSLVERVAINLPEDVYGQRFAGFPEIPSQKLHFNGSHTHHAQKFTSYERWYSDADMHRIIGVRT